MKRKSRLPLAASESRFTSYLGPSLDLKTCCCYLISLHLRPAQTGHRGELIPLVQWVTCTFGVVPYLVQIVPGRTPTTSCELSLHFPSSAYSLLKNLTFELQGQPHIVQQHTPSNSVHLGRRRSIKFRTSLDTVIRTWHFGLLDYSSGTATHGRGLGAFYFVRVPPGRVFHAPRFGPMNQRTLLLQWASRRV